MKRENVKKFLIKAYESGWHGSLELKDECVEELLNELMGVIEEKPKDMKFHSTIQTLIDSTTSESTTPETESTTPETESTTPPPLYESWAVWVNGVEGVNF